MICERRWVVALALVATVTSLMLAGQASAAGKEPGPAKLEGTWVARVVTYDGAPSPWPFQWSYLLTPDNSGRRGSIFGNVDVAFPRNPLLPVDSNSPLLGYVVLTSPDTTSFNSYWYGIKKGVPPALDVVVFIGRAWGEGKFLDSGKVENTYHFEIYVAAQDADGDGLPDEGQVPVKTFTVVTMDTRIPPVR